MCYVVLTPAVSCLERIIPELEACLDDSPDGKLTTDLAWTALKPVIRELRLKSNSQLLMPMRHALTGRRVSAVPGRDRSLVTRLGTHGLTQYRKDPVCRPS